MLSLLHIENIAVIEAADIQFDRGFNALTGETGAGKSIVIDALSAVIGERTSRDLIRTGARSALVSAEFTELPALPWFVENGFELDEDGTLLLQRELQPDGKNICRLNGRPLTVAQLKALGSQLVNIHGQHDGQQLLDPRCHLDYLDSFGATDEVLADYQSAYGAYTEVKREIESLEMDEAEKSRRIDSLTFQINELERAELKAGEEEPLLERRDLLRSAEKIIAAVEEAHFALSGDDDRDGAAALISMAEGAMSPIGRISAQASQLVDALAELRAVADDAAEQIRDLRDSLDFEPGELDEIESRLETLHRLKRKYGATVEEMLEYLTKSKKELDDIQYSSDTLARLEKKRSELLKTAKETANVLSASRRTAADAMQSRIQSELSQLDMPKVRFEVAFAPKACEEGLDSTGMDEVEFLMSANVGEALKPIQKIASGGELARIMLALKNVLAENEAVTTLVFDEVDTGVSGRAAQKVAQKMADVACTKQVLCVTHLPQIAAMADVHFSVEKGENNGRTFTQLERLDVRRRREELARLTSGEHITSAALESAGELLDAAEQYKKRRKGA